MSPTVGSLFSGIGGLDLGLERAGMRVLWQVEKDEYARKVLGKHWPDVWLVDDVRRAHGYEQEHFPICADCLVPVDLICGGFPCQDISVAGKGAGIKEGTRSGLWSEFRRIVCEVRPRYVLVENVSALRSRGLDRVLGDLASSGYDAEWDCIPAAAVGAPHRRDRIFVVAYAQRQPLRDESGRGRGANGPGPDVSGQHGEQGPVADADSQRELQPRGRIFQEWGRPSDGSSEGADLSHAQRAGLEVGCFEPAREELEAFERGSAQGNAWTVEPDVGRVAHGVPARVDRLRCLGNAVVPQVAEFVGRRILEHYRRVQESI